jgi:hypothetical protein
VTIKLSDGFREEKKKKKEKRKEAHSNVSSYHSIGRTEGSFDYHELQGDMIQCVKMMFKST